MTQQTTCNVLRLRVRVLPTAKRFAVQFPISVDGS